MKAFLISILTLSLFYSANGQQTSVNPNAPTAISVNCSANTFYGLTSNNEVLSLTINGSTVTNNGVIATSANTLFSLAAGNDLINGGNQNIFYSSIVDSVVYYDGVNWQNALFEPVQNHNAGGARGFIYYQSNTFPSQIKRFDGTSLNTIFIDSSLLFTVADIGVSDNGNVYYFSGNGSTTQFIDEISSTGAHINTYSINLNTGNGYGCFVMSNTIYIGLGPGGTPPNSLIPVTISGTTATAGTPISMPNIIIKDLAGCSGETTGIFSSDLFKPNIILYPNPSSEILHFDIAGSKRCRIKLMDASGRILLERFIEGGGESIDIRNFKAGFYFVQAVINDQIIYKSIQKL